LTRNHRRRGRYGTRDSALLEQSPELAELKAAAVSIAKNETREWYPDWLQDCTAFIDAIRKTAQRLGTPPEEIRNVARTGLLDAYWTAKRRQRQKA